MTDMACIATNMTWLGGPEHLDLPTSCGHQKTHITMMKTVPCLQTAWKMLGRI